jgi:hypothetical protein
MSIMERELRRRAYPPLHAGEGGSQSHAIERPKFEGARDVLITREGPTTAGRVHFPAHSILRMRQCPHPQRGRRPGGAPLGNATYCSTSTPTDGGGFGDRSVKSVADFVLAVVPPRQIALNPAASSWIVIRISASRRYRGDTCGRSFDQAAADLMV